MPKTCWTDLHQAAWDGSALLIETLLTSGISPSSEGQSPLLLGLQRWGGSEHHKNMLDLLWNADESPHLARWGDFAWGGGLSLLDLAVQKNLPVHINLCKERSITPQERTWAIAMLHDSDQPLICLGLAFEPPASLSTDRHRVQLMHSERQARELLEDGSGASGDGSARRL